AAWLLSGVSALMVDRIVGACIRRHPWPGAALLTRPNDYTQISALGRVLDPLVGSHRWLLLTGDSDGWRALIERAQLSHLRIARIAAVARGNLPATERVDVCARIARDVTLDAAAPVVDAAGLGSIPGSVETLEVLATALARTRRPCALIASSPDQLISSLP